MNTRQRRSRRRLIVLGSAFVAWTFLLVSCAGVLAMSVTAGRPADDDNRAASLIVAALIALLVVAWLAVPAWIARRRRTGVGATHEQGPCTERLRLRVSDDILRVSYADRRA